MNDAALRIGATIGTLAGAAFATILHIFNYGFWACAAAFLAWGWLVGGTAYVLALDAVGGSGKPKLEQERPFDGPLSGLPSVPDVEHRAGRRSR